MEQNKVISASTVFPIEKGGTGATSAADALTNLGLTATADEINYIDGATSNIQEQLDNKSEVEHTHNYAGSATAGGVATSAKQLETSRTVQTNLGSTTAVAFDGTANINPGVTGVLPIANGGTGASTTAAARTNLGVAYGTAAGTVCQGNDSRLSDARTPKSHNHAATEITSGTLPIARGGTGLTASPSMLVNLKSTTAANVLAASPRPGVTGILPITNGGTGASTVAGILNTLGISQIRTGTYTGGLERQETKTVDLGFTPSWVIVFPLENASALSDLFFKFEYRDYDDTEWGRGEWAGFREQQDSIGIIAQGERLRRWDDYNIDSDSELRVVCLELNENILTVGNARSGSAFGAAANSDDTTAISEEYYYAYYDTYVWIGGI